MKKVKKPHDSIRVSEKKKILLDIDKNVRKSSELIQQITLGFIEDDRNFIIANSEGKYIQSNTIVTRFIANIYVEKEGKKEHEFTDFAIGSGYDFLDEVNLEEKVLNCSKSAIKKLDAINIKGGEMPVIIAPGFGAVIFHEACGHGLEATSIAPHISVFSDDLGKKIASSKVTLIDDGTIENSWGGNIIDDEGEYTNKNTLIEKGILKQFLVDKANSNKMKQKSNGCGRRQDYTYPPTSRMSNTFLLPGTDKIDDMVKSINYGVYCEKMSGGSVNPATGEFNFAVETASLIENGKVVTITSTTIPVGLVDNTDYIPICKKLNDGDFIIQVSDGVVFDDMDPNSNYLKNYLVTCDINKPAKIIAQEIKEVLYLNNGGVLDDDATIIVNKIEKNS